MHSIVDVSAGKCVVRNHARANAALVTRQLKRHARAGATIYSNFPYVTVPEYQFLPLDEARARSAQEHLAPHLEWLRFHRRGSHKGTLNHALKEIEWRESRGPDHPFQSLLVDIKSQYSVH